MIYSIEIEKFPKKKQCKELISYLDENNEEWKIGIVENGFFVGYFGDPYFKDKYFDLTINKEHKLLMNSGCFWVQDLEFDTFYNFREILKNGFTDDIWEIIGELITERLMNDPGLTECEIVNK